MSETRVSASELAFAPPAPGMWELETTHHGLRPLSPMVREAYVRGFEDGTKVLVERYGLPLEGVRAKLVHGCMYVRPTGLGEGDNPKPPPPRLIMKLVAHLHPGMRRRTKTAARAWQERRWRAEVDQWFDHDRAGVTATNLAFQAVDPSTLDDGQLAGHVAELLAHFERQMCRNLATHGGDVMPVGDLLAHCTEWGIEVGEAAALLQGSSPATTETSRILAPVARALRESGSRPGTVDEVRELSADARTAVDAWLLLHAWRLVTSDDIDRPTLAELPPLQLMALLNATEYADAADPTPDVAIVRMRVPEAQRALFDALLVEARYGMRQREDIRGVCWNWTGGLLRRAALEVGRRLVGRGMLQDPEHATELFPAELTGLLTAGLGPNVTELATRAETRNLVEMLPPPRMLGEPEAPPPLDALPKAMARATAALMINLGADTTAPRDEPLHGTGIGTVVYRGRACVVIDVLDALSRLEPGDILVARFTGPSFNSLVPILGALVVEEGGVLCHAAIVAREFGLPAVIGASGATTHIPDGSLVEVDPVAGIVRVL